jgi:hypothetical protein
MKTTLLLLPTLLMSFSLFANEASIQLKKVTTLGAFNHPVIYQSQMVTKMDRARSVNGLLIVKWGLHVFEVVDGTYQCNKNKVCTLTDYRRVATYESCKKSKAKVVCSGLLTESDSSYSYTTDFRSDSSPDGTYDDSRSRESDSEFPARIVDEFADIF